MDDIRMRVSPLHPADPRRTIGRGLGILANVALRAHLQDLGNRSEATQTPETKDEEGG